MKIIQLGDAILNIHYEHLNNKLFFAEVNESMKSCPVIALCLGGVDAANVVRCLIGKIDRREVIPRTTRGHFSVST